MCKNCVDHICTNRCILEQKTKEQRKKIEDRSQRYRDKIILKR